MDNFEASSIVFSRIRKLEPESVTNKIIGFLLIQDRGEEMIRLAFGPDSLIHNLIFRIKIQFGLVSEPVLVSPPVSPSVNPPAPLSDCPFPPFSPVSSPSPLRVPNPCWEPQGNPEYQPMCSPNFIPIGYPDSLPEDFRLQNPPQFSGLEDQLEPVNPRIPPFSSDYYFPEATFVSSQPSPTLSEMPTKICHYFHKGFCKHGSNCRYFHGQPFPDMFSTSSNEVGYEDQVFSPKSLERLELEITELLKSRRGSPVSIASLPMLYYEKFGRTLQAEGYLTESQRHGKAGYNLTKLLARLKNSIRLIDRPHGQHAIILTEETPKYVDNRSERNDPGPIVSGSRQIYLTFPAESTFTEEDVSDYFNNFGPVQDVRIPCQQKRMFGFVTFASADTVKLILSQGNPHYVCGARVLVKPYREKSKLVDRKHPDAQMNYHSHYADMDSEFHSRWDWESSKLLRKMFMAEQEQAALEVQTRRLSEMQIAQKPQANQSCFGYARDDLKASEGHSTFASAERFSYLLDVLNSGSASDDNPNHMGTRPTDHESLGINLPESPFATQMASEISI